MKKTLFKRNRVKVFSLGFVLASGVLGQQGLRAELVYDHPAGDEAQEKTLEVNQPGGAALAEGGSRIIDRSSTRNALDASERARAVNNVNVTMSSDSTNKNSNSNSNDNLVEASSASLSRSELLRRERMRAELKNEDLLQERLEELRLRDEQRRVSSVMGSDLQADGDHSSHVAEDVVVSSSAQAVNKNVVKVETAPAEPVVAPPPLAPVVNGSGATVIPAEVPSDSPNISVSPRGGFSNMTDSSGYSISSKFSAGIGMGVNVSENVAIDLGYTYSEYGVALTSTNPYVLNYQYYLGNSEPLAMKQNVFDVGVRLYVLGQNYRFRPFIGGGGGYSKSFINYDSRIISGLNSQGLSYLSNDYEVSSFLGYLSAGFDVKVSSNVTIGALFKYSTILSARENQGINNAAFTGYYPNYYGGYYGSYYNYSDSDKQVLGGSLARNSFYSVLVGIGFGF